MLLQFYERVIVVRCDSDTSLVGKSGHVLGIGDEPGQTIGYGVWIEELSRLVCFEAGELQGTGEIADRSQFYDDDSSSRVRVRVIDGKGFVVG